jgi:hypothetical protein
MSIKSKMMGTTLMSHLAVVYDGRREVLTVMRRKQLLQFGEPFAERLNVHGEHQNLRSMTK